MANPDPKNQWKPGEAPYKKFLDSLTPEEREAHMLARRTRRDMKVAMKAVVEEKQAEWLTVLNNAAAGVLQKAIEDKDPQAFIAVWDRIVGKPGTEIKLDQNTPLPFDDDFGSQIVDEELFEDDDE